MNKLQNKVEKFVETGLRLDAKKRKGRITYSEENRKRLAQQETRILNSLSKILLTAGGVATVYAVFHNRADLTAGLIDITRALETRLAPTIKKLWETWHRVSPPAPTKTPEFSFFQSLKKSVKYRLTYARNSYVRGAKNFAHHVDQYTNPW